MRDIIYVKLDIVYSINHQLNEIISRKSCFFETVKSKEIISLFETVRLSVSVSPRNLYNSLKSIKENEYLISNGKKSLFYELFSVQKMGSFLVRKKESILNEEFSKKSVFSPRVSNSEGIIIFNEKSVT